MTFRNPAVGTIRRWFFAALLAGAMVLAPLPAGPSFIAPAQAGEEAAVPLQVRDSIDRALAFLARHQVPEGRGEKGGWFSPDLPPNEAALRPGPGSTAVTALSVLAFLARGNVPGQGKYGEVINRGIDFILASQDQDDKSQYNGLVGRNKGGNHVMYEHGIATVMLAECYGMVDDVRREKIGKALAKSVELILKAQEPGGKPKNLPHTGGWRYQVNSADSDLSVTGWQMMGLRGAANCGAKIPRDRLEAARKYVLHAACKPGGGFGYIGNNGPDEALTGTGILMLELFRGLDPNLLPGEHPEEAKLGGDWLRQHPPEPNMRFYYYGIYYCSQALNQLGGDYWDEIYVRKLRPTLLALQVNNPGKDNDGSFSGGSGEEVQVGPCYCTSMACLALCVPYRYLPIYQNEN